MQLTGNVQGLIDLVGGGSEVEVTQVVSSGTKIATITVDDTPTDLYAPDAGSDVEVTQVVSSGEKIATITIDDTPTDIYAPEGGSDVSVTQVISSGEKIATINVDNVPTDIYAPEGGSDVSVTQVISSGEKIATITVDDTSTDIYAPTAHYSTNEKVIGTWIDGKPLYEKTVEWSGTSYNNSVKINSGIDSSNVKLREFVGVGYMHDNINELAIPYCNLTASQSLSINVADGIWLYNSGVNRIVKVVATIRYTKNSDT